MFSWGERQVLAEPDGSALYIPTGTEYNKAYMFPADATGDINWRGVRFPVQAIRGRELSLSDNGLWQDSAGQQYAVLDGGHLLYVTADGNNEQWKTMADAFITHGFKMNSRERWHVEYRK